MPLYDRFDAFPVEVRPRQSPGIKQHLSDIFSKCVAVPHPEMSEFVPTEEKPLKVKAREHVIRPGDPLRHPVVVRVFRFESKLEESSAGDP